MALKFGSTAAHAILMMFAGWIHREQEAIVAYQKEEIRALREMLGGEGCPVLVVHPDGSRSCFSYENGERFQVEC